MDPKEYIDLTINTTTNEDLNTIIDAIYEIIPMKTIKFVELPKNNYVYMYINNNNYVEKLEQNGMRFTGKSMDNSLPCLSAEILALMAEGCRLVVDIMVSWRL